MHGGATILWEDGRRLTFDCGFDAVHSMFLQVWYLRYLSQHVSALTHSAKIMGLNIWKAWHWLILQSLEDGVMVIEDAFEMVASLMSVKIGLLSIVDQEYLGASVYSGVIQIWGDLYEGKKISGNCNVVNCKGERTLYKIKSSRISSYRYAWACLATALIIITYKCSMGSMNMSYLDQEKIFVQAEFMTLKVLLFGYYGIITIFMLYCWNPICV